MLTGYLCNVNRRRHALKKKEAGNEPQVELLQHCRVDDAKLANTSVLAAQAKMHRGSVAREESLLLELLDPVAIGLGGILLDLVVDALFGSEAFVVSEEGGPEHGEDTVEQAVYDLETT